MYGIKKTYKDSVMISDQIKTQGLNFLVIYWSISTFIELKVAINYTGCGLSFSLLKSFDLLHPLSVRKVRNIYFTNFFLQLPSRLKTSVLVHPGPRIKLW